MRKILYLALFNSVVLLLVYTFSATLTSCTKEGPAGSAGADGTDANSWCVVCHSYAKMDAVYAEYNTSLHGTGTSWEEEGSNKSCVACHSNQGYVETYYSGEDTMAVVNPFPESITCDGCHYNHVTLDSSNYDYALRVRDGFRLRMDSSFVTLNGIGNTCGRCHQARVPSPYLDPVNFQSTTDSIKPGNWRFGTHYGVAANIFAGKGFNFPGTLAYENSDHCTAADCGDCHMADANGTLYGGHTWRVKAENGTENVAACIKCHTGDTSFDIGGKQTEIAALIQELGNKLYDTYGVLEKVDGEFTGYMFPENATTYKVSYTVAAAVINFQLAFRDKSNGVHNYKYTKALLRNTIDAI